MRITVCSRKTIERLIASGEFPMNTAVISFYDPPAFAADEYQAVDFSGVGCDVFTVAVPDLDWDAFEENQEALRTFFPEADPMADFILQSHRAGKDLICQCDYGQSRSAGCAMAIWEFFDHEGERLFKDPRYFPNQLIFGKLLAALRHRSQA